MKIHERQSNQSCAGREKQKTENVEDETTRRDIMIDHFNHPSFDAC
jgi:hypothetical protein